MLFLDCETIGFYGPVILFQYAVDDGPVHIHNVFTKPVKETIKLIEWFCEHEVAAYNLVFDWFHVVQTYNVLIELEDKFLPPYPDDYYEAECRNPCTKYLVPKGALDLMIHCQEGDYQYLMERKDISIRRVPRVLAYKLCGVLEERVKLRDSLFARYKDPKQKRWRIQELSTPHPDFVNVKLKFAPSKKLEVIAKDVLGIGKADWDFSLLPKIEEYGYRPYGGNWIDYVDIFVAEWDSDLARSYAHRDVEVLQQLYEAFDKPKAGSLNSELCICVANVRWRGFPIDKKKCAEVIDYYDKLITDFPININSPKQVKAYLKAKMSPMERSVFHSTAKPVLEKIVKKGGGAADRAQKILDARQAKYRKNLFEKILFAGKFHVSNKIFGALSDRMSGADGLNSQGIPGKHRDIILMAYPGEVAEGGDFDGFEISIGCSIYDDPNMIEDFKSGKKMHAIMGAELFEMDYEDVLMTEKGKCGVCKGTGTMNILDRQEHARVSKWCDEEWKGEAFEKECDFCSATGKVNDAYTKGKSTFFARMFGAGDFKAASITNLDLGHVTNRMKAYDERYSQRTEYLNALEDEHKAIYQPELGGKVYWKTPKKYIETKLGSVRRFDYEYLIMQCLFELAQDIPPEWHELKKLKIRRSKDRTQTPAGAIASAIYGAVFGVQGTIFRQIGNHIIQSLGAKINKLLQLLLWKKQPQGIHDPVISVFNNHDELQAAGQPEVMATCEADVYAFIDEMREIVPLLSMTWDTNKKNWQQ
jgi:hypothetical protein